MLLIIIVSLFWHLVQTIAVLLRLSFVSMLFSDDAWGMLAGNVLDVVAADANADAVDIAEVETRKAVNYLSHIMADW